MNVESTKVKVPTHELLLLLMLLPSFLLFLFTLFLENEKKNANINASTKMMLRIDKMKHLRIIEFSFIYSFFSSIFLSQVKT